MTLKQALWVPIGFLLGCSSSSPPATSDLDASVPLPDAALPDDAEAPDSAPDSASKVTVTLPQAVSFGGPLIKNPKIVPVVWSSDPIAGDINAMLTAATKTTYWEDMIGEYGIFAPTFAPTVTISDPVAATLDGTTDIPGWLVAHADGSKSGFPAADASTFYVLIYPPGTSITIPTGKSCTAWHGYHDDVAVNGLDVPFAVISRCSGLPEVSVTGVQYVSAVISHELLEGLGDPMVETQPAYLDVDPEHRAWAEVTNGEIGDLCALQGSAFFQPTDFPYTVQKIWSNAAAKALKDPCNPEKAGEPYFNSAPRLDDWGTLVQYGKAKTVKVAVGQQRTIGVDLFADGPTAGPWTVSAMQVRGSGNVTFAFDRTSGKAGDTLNLTVTSVSKSTDGVELFAISSTLGTRTNLWFGAVSH